MIILFIVLFCIILYASIAGGLFAIMRSSLRYEFDTAMLLVSFWPFTMPAVLAFFI